MPAMKRQTRRMTTARTDLAVRGTVVPVEGPATLGAYGPPCDPRARRGPLHSTPPVVSTPAHSAGPHTQPPSAARSLLSASLASFDRAGRFPARTTAIHTATVECGQPMHRGASARVGRGKGSPAVLQLSPRRPRQCSPCADGGQCPQEAQVPQIAKLDSARVRGLGAIMRGETWLR